MSMIISLEDYKKKKKVNTSIIEDESVGFEIDSEELAALLKSLWTDETLPF